MGRQSCPKQKGREEYWDKLKRLQGYHRRESQEIWSSGVPCHQSSLLPTVGRVVYLPQSPSSGQQEPQKDG